MGPQYNGPLGPDGQPLVQGADKKPSAIGNILMQTLTGVLGAMKGNQAVRQQQFKEQMEKDKLQTEKDQNEATIKFHHDQLDQQDKHFSLVQKAAKAVQDVQTALHKQEITKNLQAGIKLPGDTVTPGVGDPSVAQGGFSPINPAQATSEVHQLPGDLGSVTIDTPEVAATKDAAVARIAGAPKNEFDIKKELALQDDRNKQSEANKSSDFGRRMLEKSFDDSRNKDIITSHEKIAKMEADSRERIARIAHQTNMFGTLDPQQVQTIANPYLEGLKNGTISAAQVKKDFSEKGLVGGDTAILSAFMGSGMVPPTDKQVSFVQNVKPIVDSLPLIQQYIDLLPKSSGGVGGAFAGITHPDILNPQLESKFKEIEFNIATVAKNLSGDQGQRLQKALLKPAEGGYLPDKFKATSYNVDNFNKLVEVLHSAIDSSLGSLTPAQRSHIKENMGLGGISRLHSDGQPVRNSSPVPQQVPQSTQPGATHIWTPQGIQPVGTAK